MSAWIRDAFTIVGVVASGAFLAALVLVALAMLFPERYPHD